MILQDKENLFKNPSESYAEEAYESCQLLDQDKENDEDTNFLWIICRVVYLIFWRKNGGIAFVFHISGVFEDLPFHYHK